MPAIDGVASGFDTSALINSITELALIPVVGMRERKGDLESTSEKLTEFSNLVTELGEAAEELSADGALGSLTASTTNDLVEVNIDDSVAQAGDYVIETVHRAKNDTESSQGQTSEGLGTLATGTLTVNYAGTSYDIIVDSSNNGLAALASDLNEAVPGLNATVIDQGFGSSPFRLSVSGETGADNSLSFSYSGFSGTATEQLGFTETQAAEDAQIVVNGLTVQSSTDTFTTLPGVTLDISGVPDNTQFRTTVAPDPDAMVDKVQAFVDKYNEVQNFYKRNKVYNAEAGIVGPFAGESSVRRVAEGLGGLISDSYTVPDSVTGLSELGFATERGGTITLDTEALRTQLVENFDAVESFLSSDDGPLKALQARIEDVYVHSETGTLGSRKDSLESTIEDLEESISRQEAYVDDYSARLRKRFTAMEGAIASAQSTGSFLAAMIGSGE